ncbi:MAG: hypothetical protein IPM74_07865 [Crocinitomicaceae bacterium]|nr:hypothetical protein [Crocinitomicaceae bacterium]MBK8925815.1 hypothetical protein [Crocinitomicaceae bacterium]
MIANRSYFKLLSVISLFILSCQTYQDHFTYATIYHGETLAGFHARALCLVNSEAVIVAGPNGQFCGKYFSGDLIEQPALTGAEDIRDMHLFNNGTMVLMNSGDTGKIYVVGFNGEQATVLDTPGVFLDGLDFWDEKNGIAFGDPVGNTFFLARTNDGGRSWSAFSPQNIPEALQHESAFAASGTGIQCIDDSTVYFVSGMADTARLFISHDRGMNWTALPTPMKSGDGYGIYSMYFWNSLEGMIIGGSWEEIKYHKKICFLTQDGGKTWINRSKGLGGYSSCILGNKDGSCIFSTGDRGTYYTLDRGLHWNLLFERNYYSIAMNEEFLALIGRNGTIEILRYQF